MHFFDEYQKLDTRDMSLLFGGNDEERDDDTGAGGVGPIIDPIGIG